MNHPSLDRAYAFYGFPVSNQYEIDNLPARTGQPTGRNRKLPTGIAKWLAFHGLLNYRRK